MKNAAIYTEHKLLDCQMSALHTTAGTNALKITKPGLKLNLLILLTQGNSDQFKSVSRSDRISLLTPRNSSSAPISGCIEKS